MSKPARFNLSTFYALIRLSYIVERSYLLVYLTRHCALFVRSHLRGDDMGISARRFCKHSGCSALVGGAQRYCDEHKADEQEAERKRDERRGSARERGYSTQWNKYSKAFLAMLGHQFCSLHLDEGCAVVAQCVDHIDPPRGAGDPKFWDKTNHQAACIHCNSVKGRRAVVGTWEFGNG